MARSVWKGPFVDGYLLKKADKARALYMSRRNEEEQRLGWQTSMEFRGR